jgi:hypothetical protein
MSMSKKDFIALADEIRDYNSYAETVGYPRYHQRQIEHLADFCRSQNGRFLRDRWLGYIAGTCGKNGGRK